MVKILIVEDDLSTAESLYQLLASHAYGVDLATDAEVGLELVNAYDYDLIVLDVVGPGLDGLGLCQRLRAQHQQLPILLLTDQEGEGQQQAEALKSGADDYVVKPFEAEALIARLRALLRRSGGNSVPILTWGRLSIDPSSQRVTYGNQLLSLTPQAYGILELLLRHPQTVFSARAILNHAWESTPSPGEEAVRYHIKELRQKLSAATAPSNLVEILHRVGYRLNPMYSSWGVTQTEQPPTTPQMAELTVTNEQLRTTLEELRTVQEELHQQNLELLTTRDAFEAEHRRYQDLFEFATDGYLVTDCHGNIEEANRAAAVLLGVESQTLIHKPLSIFIDAGERQDFRTRFTRLDWPASWEVTLQPRRGEPRSVLVAVTTIVNALQQVMGLRWLLRDIRDRKQLELSLQSSEAALSQILNSAIAAIARFRVFKNKNWTYDYFSAGCETVFGYTAEELMADQQLWWSRVWPADRETVLLPLIDDFFAERDAVAEFQFCHKDGSLRWIRSRHTSQRLDDDHCTVTVVNSDISERKQAELALQQQICQEQLLTDIAQEIRQSLDLDQVLHSTVERVKEWLTCDRVVIVRFRPDWQGNVMMEAVGDQYLAIQSTTIVDPCFEDRFVELYRQGHVTVLNDINQPDLEPCCFELLRQFQVQACLTAPILQGNDLWGLLMAHHCAAPRQWQTNEIKMLQQLANQVGIASQQSELYEQTRSELSARKQMQAVLEESEARFRALSAAAPIGICQSNVDGICLYVNPRWCEISGLSFNDCLGNGWLQSVHPDDRAMLTAAWASYLQGGSDILPEFRLVTSKGDIRWISAQVATIKSAAGEVIGYVSTDEDITERKQAEEALRESEQRLKAILDHSPAVIYLLDRQDQYLLVNRSYAAMLSTSPDSLVGKSLHEVWPAAVAEAFAAQNRTVLETGQLLQTEDAVPLKNGTRSYVTVKFPLYDATGKAYAVGGLSTDITEQKKLEAQFYQAQRLESLGTLASGIAHDLNNILAPVLTTAQLLRLSQKGLDAKGLEFVNLLENSAKRGSDLVKQILSVTRASQGEQTAVDLAALLQDEIEIIQHSFPKSIEILVDVASPKETQSALGTILADPSYLHQIILNLCINARDAMPEGGTLTLSATQVFVDEAMAARNLEAQVGNYAVITVADTGTGIPPEVQERMFDPFFTTKAPGQGTGLGLATVRGLVKANQGFLQVLSEVGQGSQFKVYFPLLEGDGSEPEPSQPATEVSPAHHAALVLVVEDEDSVRKMLRSILETQHFRTLLAQDGADALEQYHHHQSEIQLVVTDIMMPTMDGLTLIKTLKAMNSKVPMIALSGVPTHEETALATGADYFLAKPFDLEIFLSQIETLLSPEVI